MNPLLILADRVEGLSGPCRETDLAIFNATSPQQYRWATFGGAPGLADQQQIIVELEPEWLLAIRSKGDKLLAHWEPDIRSCPAYTASLDAAMTLIPERVTTEIVLQDRHSLRWKWGLRDFRAVRHNARAATPALTLTAASLRAIAANQEISS